MLGLECASVTGAVESLREALQRGRSVVLLVDRNYGGSKRSFKWFDRPVQLPRGHVALAVRCRVPIVTCACVFAENRRFKFVFRGPHYPRTDVDSETAMNDLQRHCIADMEELIRDHPDQWFHFRPLGGVPQ